MTSWTASASDPIQHAAARHAVDRAIGTVGGRAGARSARRHSRSDGLTVRCPVCDVDAEVRLRGPGEATVGTIAAALERRPVALCPGDHGATPAEVVGAAMEAVDDQVERARSRWLRADACRVCSSDLSMPVRRTTRTVTVEDPRMPIVTLHLDLPMTRCGECGADQVPSRSHEDLTVVIPALFAPPETPGEVTED